MGELLFIGLFLKKLFGTDKIHMGVTIMQKGDLIRVRAFGGKELIRRLIEVKDSVVLICKEEEYLAAQKEGREPTCVGFHIEDVIESMTC